LLFLLPCSKAWSWQGSGAGLDKIKAIGYDLDYTANNCEQLLKRFQDALIKTQ
jgi:hypothetical protein